MSRIAPWLKPIDLGQSLDQGLNAGLALRRARLEEARQKQAQVNYAEALRQHQQGAMYQYMARQQAAQAANERAAAATKQRADAAAALHKDRQDALALKSARQDTVNTNASAFKKEYKRGSDPLELLSKYPAASNDKGVQQIIKDYSKTEAGKNGIGKVYHEPGIGIFKVNPDGAVSKIYDFGKMSPADKAMMDVKGKELVNLHNQMSKIVGNKPEDVRARGELARRGMLLENDIKQYAAPAAQPTPSTSAALNGDQGGETSNPAPVQGGAAAALTAPPVEAAPVLPPSPIVQQQMTGSMGAAPDAPISASAALSVPQAIVPRGTVAPAPAVVAAPEPVVVPERVPEQKHIDVLLKNPDTAPQFDEYFGKGAADKILTDPEDEANTQ